MILHLTRDSHSILQDMAYVSLHPVREKCQEKDAMLKETFTAPHNFILNFRKISILYHRQHTLVNIHKEIDQHHFIFVNKTNTEKTISASFATMNILSLQA